jgi:hypothetical protein
MQFLPLQRPVRARQCCVQALFSFGLVLSLYAAQPEMPVKMPEPNPHQSVFADDPKLGKDPFFPNSLRRAVTNEVAAEAVKAPINNIKLQGISGSAENRLSIINGRTFGLNEEAEMKINGQSVRIRVVEIRAQSVMVSVNGGAPQEVAMGQHF